MMALPKVTQVFNTFGSAVKPVKRVRRKERYNPFKAVKMKIRRMIESARKPLKIRLAIRRWRRRGQKPPPKLF